jgi:putative transposase
MARIPRKAILENESYFHVTWKCHNENFLLQHEQTKSYLYDLLVRYKSKYRIKIFGYCFMDNHPHIVGFCESVAELSRFFQIVNGSLARFVNREFGRRGQVVMDRFRSPRIESERYLLNVLHYVDLNPVRAGLCRRAKDYKWSSHRARITGRADPLLDALPAGAQLTSLEYENQSRYVLENGSSPVLFKKNTYFIGTPPWIRAQRYRMFKQLLKTKVQA